MMTIEENWGNGMKNMEDLVLELLDKRYRPILSSAGAKSVDKTWSCRLEKIKEVTPPACWGDLCRVEQSDRQVRTDVLP